jgi:Ca2+-binding RTX toxin-like protein
VHLSKKSMANITGTTSSDSLAGTTGDDYIQGLAGDDTINPGLGRDTVNGGEDNDLLVLDYSSNSYMEDNGGLRGYPSRIENGISVGNFYAYKSNSNFDQVRFQQIDRFQLTGTKTADFITTANGNDLLNGDAGNDNLDGGLGNNTLIGGAGNDAITSGAGNDNLNGGLGEDSLNGGTGNNALNGGAGKDFYVINTVDDTVTETSTIATEIDTVQSSITYTLINNLENLTLTGIDWIDGTGNALNNNLVGNDGKNRLYGMLGNDSLRGAAGNDVMRGGDGNDTLSGGAKSDAMAGGYGNDILNGDLGNDNLTGGNGDDQFIYDTNSVFTTSQVGIDRLLDFVSGSDKILLDKTTFSALSSLAGNGFNVASEFAVVGSDAAVTSEAALIIYSSETGKLFYNQNGAMSGLGSGAQFAILTGLPDISANDFILQA